MLSFGSFTFTFTFYFILNYWFVLMPHVFGPHVPVTSLFAFEFEMLVIYAICFFGSGRQQLQYPNAQSEMDEAC